MPVDARDSEVSLALIGSLPTFPADLGIVTFNSKKFMLFCKPSSAGGIFGPITMSYSMLIILPSFRLAGVDYCYETCPDILLET